MLQTLQKVLITKRAKHILLYYPLLGEFDITALLYKLKKKRGVCVYLPKLKGDEFEIIPFRFPLFKERFRLYEPRGKTQKNPKIDAMVVPMLGWDCKMRRIGFGKGYYDRFYAKLSNKPYIIFVSLLGLYVKENVTQDFDIGADLIVTPRYKVRRKKNGMDMDKPYNLDCFSPSDFFYHL